MIKSFDTFMNSVNESADDGMTVFTFEYEDTYSKGHKCTCSGSFRSLEDAVKFFGLNDDPTIISWKQIENQK